MCRSPKTRGQARSARDVSRQAGQLRSPWFWIAESARSLEQSGHEAAARQAWAAGCLAALGAGEPKRAATFARMARRPDLKAQCEQLGAQGFAGPGVKVADDVVVFICGLPASGKSTVAWLLSGCVDAAPHPIAIETSAIIAERWERAHGVEAGTVLAARAEDPNAYRRVLGPWGERMARRNGWSAARIGVARGRIIAGTRRLGELQAAIREADRRGLRSVVLWVERDGASASDNIESGIRRLAEGHVAVIKNDGDVARLLQQVGRIGALRQPASGAPHRLPACDPTA